MKRFKRFSILSIFLFIISLISLSPIPSPAGRMKGCLMCHSDPDLAVKKGEGIISLFVDEISYRNSVHGEIECIACHIKADVKGFPHPEDLSPVNCGTCHKGTQKVYEESLHYRDDT
ncbi:MAG: hypothetical protein HY999_06035 [Nitrospinae bacterium]|nr:hypothetical protein [Nitrospinota bacterium]